MPSLWADCQLGAFLFTGNNGAAITGPIKIGAKPRTIPALSNALSVKPVQGPDFQPDFRQIEIVSFSLWGIESQSETAANHLKRLLTNLKTEVGRATNKLTISWWGLRVPYVYTVVKNQDFPYQIEALTQTRKRLDNLSLTLSVKE
jgi:hypothetical protein